MAEIIVIMGPQGAGKGTQARRLADDLGLPTIATGDILRQVSMEDTDLARKVKETQEAGNLVSDDILAQIIEERLGQEDCEPGCLLDGFPRTIPQAEFLDQVASRRNLPVHAVSIE
ncbi:MAG: adenylate kinase family protein, partial [Blastocatellia bacterium]